MIDLQTHWCGHCGKELSEYDWDTGECQTCGWSEDEKKWIVPIILYVLLGLLTGCSIAHSAEIVLVRDYRNIPEQYDEVLLIGTESQINNLCDVYGCPYRWVNMLSGYTVTSPQKGELRR